MVCELDSNILTNANCPLVSPIRLLRTVVVCCPNRLFGDIEYHRSRCIANRFDFFVTVPTESPSQSDSENE